MFCPQCGADVHDDHAFCQTCGAALPAARRADLTPSRSMDALNLLGDQGIRMLAIALGGLLALFLLAELVKVVVVIALPLVIILAVLHWARERRRRYY